MSALRLGLMSTANINREILSAATGTDRIDVVAVGSREPATAESYAREHGLERWHGSYDELLADDDIDAVYVSLPNALHHAWTTRALAADKHVLCEKPYSRHPAEVDEGWATAESSGLVLMEAFMYRHHPQTALVAELVAGGAIGRLGSIRAVFTFPLEDLGDVRASADLGGGALMDVGCYCVSVARVFAGEPVSVTADRVDGGTGVDLSLHGTMRFAGDVVAQIEASFMAPRRQLLELTGDEGMLTVSAPFRVDWGGMVTVARRVGGSRAATDTEAIEVPMANAYQRQLENFADAIGGREPQLLGRADAYGQAQVIAALYRAADEGGRVDL